MCLCSDCLKKITAHEKEVEEQLRLLSGYLTDDLIRIAQCTLQRDQSGIAYFAIKGLEKYGYHKQTDILITKEQQQITDLLSHSKEASIIITPSMMKDFGLVDHLLYPSVDDIFQAKIITEFVDSSYLTNRPSDKDIIDALSTNSGALPEKSKSALVSGSLFHEVPIVGDATIESIINLRKNNEDSFTIYRDSINHFLKDTKNFNQKMIAELQRDVIAPEIHKMEQTIKLNKKALIKNSSRNIALATTGITVGVFSGIFPLDYAALLGVIGGLPFIGKCITDLIDAFSDEVIKSNNFYFLWKLGRNLERLS
ncbi:hypothetical protein SDC9_148564 [bioreactor metagenome]|uniref:Uncharacterized protein n=1 Tax=bioreactor metagenome TaxID=1076179 RepID=A0A645EH59_9ZZZZ